jgi:hypothetical protein
VGGAVEAAVLALDLGERGDLADALVLGRLQERPAVALDPAAPGRVGAFMGVPFVAADLVDGARAEADDAEGVKADVGVGTAARIARWHSPLMSIETVWIESLASPSSAKKASGGAAAAGVTPHDRVVAWSATVIR